MVAFIIYQVDQDGFVTEGGLDFPYQSLQQVFQVQVKGCRLPYPRDGAQLGIPAEKFAVELA